MKQPNRLLNILLCGLLPMVMAGCAPTEKYHREFTGKSLNKRIVDRAAEKLDYIPLQPEKGIFTYHRPDMDLRYDSTQKRIALDCSKTLLESTSEWKIFCDGSVKNVERVFKELNAPLTEIPAVSSLTQ